MADLTYEDRVEDGTKINRVTKDGGASGHMDRVHVENASATSTGGALESTQATQATMVTGAKSAIGLTALQMTATSTPAKKGVLVRAASTNTAKVFVGNATATAGSADATDGYELGASETVSLEIANANMVYVISTATGQKVFFVAV